MRVGAESMYNCGMIFYAQRVTLSAERVMELVHGLPQPINAHPTVLTIGVFDGVHRGHQQLIDAAVARAASLGVQSAVLTFDPHPDIIINPNRQRLHLSTLDQRMALIAQLGADVLVVLPFSEATKNLGAQEFMAQICGALALRELWVGYDFALGRRREGDVARLRAIGIELGYTVHSVAPLLLDNAPVSSSRIRAALAAGEVALAAGLLGRPFGVAGPVVQGDQRGRTIGFPTANVALDANQMLPIDGVYVCRAYLRDESFGAVTNVGVRPTFGGLRRTVETYILDFAGDIYGETLQVEFLHRLRGEQKFSGVGELVAQIGVDTAAARAWLAAQSNSSESGVV